ncbi:hypothetical protein F5141DRAFT_1156746 [Pisolithus sp. B1]|nr:hypothetical protein F5141DRAFT_1156746 [Pisolithus sp. B1]
MTSETLLREVRHILTFLYPQPPSKCTHLSRIPLLSVPTLMCSETVLYNWELKVPLTHDMRTKLERVYLQPEFGRREKTTNVSWVHATKRSSTSHVPPSNCGASKHSNRCIHRWVRCWSATISPSAASRLPLPTQPDGAHVDEPANELQGY